MDSNNAQVVIGTGMLIYSHIPIYLNLLITLLNRL